MIALHGLAQATPDTREKARLTDAAQQFEAVFLQELLKPLQDGTNDGAEDKSPGSDTLSSYGTEAVAKAIAKGGGLGIARQIVAKVELEKTRNVAGTKVSPSHADQLK